MKIHILSYPRTQCTYLLNSVTQHYCPQHIEKFDYINEPFNQKPDVDSKLDYFENSRDIVVKNHVRHFYTFETHGVDRYTPVEKIDRFFSMGWQTFVIIRKNLFDQTISYCRSRLTNEWNNYTDQMITIDPDFFNQTRLALWGSVNRLYEQQHNINYHKILYTEDFTNDSVLDCEKITTTIDPTTTKLLSNKSPNKKQTIKNYDQLHQQFADTDDFPEIPGVQRKGCYIENVDWSNQ